MMVRNKVPRPQDSSEDGKRKRASKPKVKTGCLTCKIRRVKCDENKPECRRCIEFGIKCDGYDGTPSQAKPPNKPQNISLRPPRPHTEQRLSTILPDPCCSRFQNQEEHHFFQLFTTQTAPHLGGYLDPFLWNRIVLQASEAEESIRHAIISIGALDMTMMSSYIRGPQSKTSKAASQRHFFALKQYSKAITELRRKVLLSNLDLRNALVASILIICFEFFHQNYDSAASQIRSAVRLIESKGKELQRSKDIEEDLLCLFDRLGIQTMSSTEPRIDLFTIDEHRALKDSNATLLGAVPPIQFEDIATARNYFYNMARRHAHFIVLSKKMRGILKNDNPSLEKPSSFSSSSYLGNPQSYMDQSVYLEQSKAFREAELWMWAFQPLYVKHRSQEQNSRQGRDFLAVTVMRLHFLVVTLSHEHMFYTSELEFDKSLPAFKEMVGLCEDLLGDNVEHTLGYGKDEMTFVFEMQTLMALDNIAKKCRDPVVRRAVINLLLKKPMREGVKDSLLSAKVGEWVMMVEEAGMVNGFIGDKWRTRNVSVSLDSEGQSAKVTCWVGGVDGERREGVIELLSYEHGEARLL